jgi:ribosome-associated protein
MKTPILTKLAVAALEDLKAQDIRVLDVKHVTTVTDAMIICTGTSNRHVKSLAQNVVDKAKENGVRPLGIEGLDQGEWALVDLNGVVVHVMQAQARVFYQLEKLWDVPPPVVVPSHAGKAPGASRRSASGAAKSKAKPKPKPKAQTKTKTKAQSKPPSKSAPKAKSRPKAAPRPAAKTALKAKPKAKPKAKSAASRASAKAPVRGAAKSRPRS